MKVIIEGEHVKLVEEKIAAQCTLTTYLSQILKHMPVSTGLLPAGIIFYASGKNTKWYLFEVTPRTLDISYKSRRSNTATKHTVSIPYVYALITTVDDIIEEQGIKFFCNTQRIDKMDDPIFRTPFLNIYDQGSGNVCLGSMRVDPDTPITQRIRAVLDTFFLSVFNDDLSPAWPAEFSSIAEWEKLTQKNPLCALACTYVPWVREKPVTLKDFLKTEFERYGDEHEFF